MQIIFKSVLLSSLSLVLSQWIHAKPVSWCVYDIAGTAGDVMQTMKDYALAAKQWDVDIQTKVYRTDQQAVKAFQNKECDAVVASAFLTRDYNHFMGTIGAVGLIPNHYIAQKLFKSLGHPNLAKYMVSNEFEAVGWMPIGPAYFMVKDRNINSITQLAGRRVGLLKEDPSQQRMARRVGAKPIFINFENVGKHFINNEIDIMASPIYAYRPLELYRGLDPRGGVINFPISYVSLSFIVRKNAFPKNFGQKSRIWFQARTPKMMRTVLQWERSMPNKYWYDIPISDRISYQRLVSQLRKEFVQSGIYHEEMTKIVLKLQCAENDKHFECKK